MSKDLKIYRDKSTLEYLYEEKMLTTPQIGDIAGCHKSTVNNWLEKHGIEKREPGRGKEKYNNKEILERLYLDEGKTTYEIAELADCTQASVSRWLINFDIKTRTPSRPPELDDREFLEDCYHGEGMSMRSISQEVGCSPPIVSKALEEHGIEKRESGTGKKNPYPVLNDEEQMREWYCEQDLIFDEIAEKVGCERSTVGNALERLGIEARTPKPRWEPPISEEELRELYHGQMLSLDKIGDRFDTTGNSIGTWCRHYDIEIRPPGAIVKGEEHHLYKDGSSGACYGSGWYRQRKKVLKRDDYECRDCGMDDVEHRETYGKGLHVHHIERFDPEKPPEPQHREGNLLSLCQSCHLGKWEHVDEPELALELLPS